MGWKLKVLAILFAFFALSLGAWLIAGAIFAYLFIHYMVSNKRSSDDRRAKEKVRGEPSKRLPLRQLAGFVFAGLGVTAYASGGRFSPVFLASIGLLLLLYRRLPRLFPRARLVKESVLIRGVVVSFRWFAAAEFKISTRDPASVLCRVNGRILMVSALSLRIFLVCSALSLTRRAAERKLAEKFGQVARTIAPSGVYLLPLESRQALNLVNPSVDNIGMKTSDFLQHLSSTEFDTISIETVDGQLKFASVYLSKQGKKSRRHVLLLPPREIPVGHPSLLQLFETIGRRGGWPNPDRYVTFLSSLFATRGEESGHRITETVTSSNQQLLLVKSVGTPFVELTKAQMRAIIEIYR